MNRPLALLLALAVLVPSLARAQTPASYDSVRADAERLYAEHSYAKARELYLKAKVAPHPDSEERWIDFRLADTLWRSEAASPSSDTTKSDAARAALESLVAATTRDEDRDRVWAEANESLGDFRWTRPDSRDWGGAWPYYQAALDWWSGARDVELARSRYLEIVWRAAEPPNARPYEYYGYYGNTLPPEVLESAIRIAAAPADKARAHFYLASTFVRSGDMSQADRVPEEYEAALAAGRSSAWYDDALFQYANFLAESGRVVYGADGGASRSVDYPKALELYRRLTTEFTKGQSRYYDDALAKIDAILKPSVVVSVDSVFLPGSEVEYGLSWRNAARLDLALYKVDLPKDTAFKKTKSDVEGWVNELALTGRKPVSAWARQTNDTGDHIPGQATVRYDQRLQPGAYVLEAKTEGGAASRGLVLVTDTSVLVKVSGRQALAYVCGAADGAPVSGARVAMCEASYDEPTSTWNWKHVDATANKDGIAVFQLSGDASYDNLLFLAADDERQAFSYGQRQGSGSSAAPWRIYAYTDRPAYRPGEEAKWKLVARQYANGAYSTPAGRVVEYEIDDPRGTKVVDGRSTLNAFGSAWGGLQVTAAMPLGEYRVTFWDEGRKSTIGSATLFRLEEYKLPEFKVAIATPEENGKKKAFRLGESVQVDVTAEYYFGGPVANATVEVVVYQNSYSRYWHAPHDFPWLYEDSQPSRSYYSRGSVAKRDVVKTDADGKARITFDTPRSGQDFEYTIEARVTDASRREIVASDTVRVTRQRYYVDATPDRVLLRPTDEARVALKALDANDRPVSVSGTVKITRDYWWEVWTDPKGKEVSGDDLRKAREKASVFPPTPKPGERGWTLKFRGYQHDDVATQSVQTDANGDAEVRFTPAREGYYRVAWSSRDASGPPIAAETTVWAATNATTDLGYHSGDLEIVVSSDTARVGETTPVMIAAPTNGRYVLFSVEGDDLYSYQLIRMTGSVKLIDLPIEERHVPNVYLSVASIADETFSQDTKELVVPPTRSFLNVEVKSDRDVYEPRDEGTLTVTARDSEGKPVEAEVGLGFVDDSVYYIQQDYAGDPRQVYYGDRRDHRVTTQSSFQSLSYQRLGPLSAEEQAAGEGSGAGSDAFSRSVGGVVSNEPPPPPSAAPAKSVREFAVLETQAKLFGGPGDKLKQTDGTPATLDAGDEPAVVVRSDFRSTVFWQPDVVTGPDGTATVKVSFPDSLTSWRATARAATRGSQFGIANATARTRKPLTARLEAPRFFVVGDTVTLSAIVNNNTDAPLSVTPTLGAEGIELTSAAAAAATTIPANGEQRFDWTAEARAPGPVKLSVTARGGSYADAMERTFAVYEHGVDKLVAISGKARTDDTTVDLTLPAERKPGTTSLDVQVSPSIAVTMLDAIPYLVDYPYGCTEQTMSRFLPAVVVSKTLTDLGARPDQIEGRIFGGVEPASADATHPGGRRSLGELAKVRAASLDRLYDFQHADGGWGWWKDDDSDHYMTAYVIWGLTLAKRAGVAVKQDALDRAADYLNDELIKEETRYDMQAWMLHALAAYHGDQGESAGLEELAAFDNVYTHRDLLPAYTRALLTLAAHDYKLDEQARTLVGNLANGAKIDREPASSPLLPAAPPATGAPAPPAPAPAAAATAAAPAPEPIPEVIATAHWGEDAGWWRWSDGSVEATAFSLAALVAVDPQNELVEPAMNWLVKNRRGAQWSNTRDTAYAILALDDYLKASKELGAGVSYEVFVNGTSVATGEVAPGDALAAPSRFAVDPSLVRDGANEVRIVRRSGTGAIYFAAEARFFSAEEPVTAAGNDLFVRRQYFRLVGRQTLLKGFVYDRVPLADGDTIKSGERIETVLTIETKNDDEYLLFEDLKPAGFEAVEVRSGEPTYAKELKASAVSGERSGDAADYTARTTWVYRELRDREVALFVRNMPQGDWEIRYDVRAETPGVFHALPLVGQAMYVPEIRGNSAEQRIKVEE